MWRIRNFFKYLFRSCRWFIRLWGDENWNQYYLYKVIYLKLNDFKKTWADRNKVWIVEKDRLHILKQLTICTELCKRLLEDNYLDCKEWNELGEKWGKYELKKSLNNEYSILTHTKVKTKEDEKQCSKDFCKLSELVDYRRKRDKKYMFKIMEKYIDDWWD